MREVHHTAGRIRTVRAQAAAAATAHLPAHPPAGSRRPSAAPTPHGSPGAGATAGGAAAEPSSGCGGVGYSRAAAAAAMWEDYLAGACCFARRALQLDDPAVARLAAAALAQYKHKAAAAAAAARSAAVATGTPPGLLSAAPTAGAAVRHAGRQGAASTRTHIAACGVACGSQGTAASGGEGAATRGVLAEEQRREAATRLVAEVVGRCAREGRIRSMLAAAAGGGSGKASSGAAAAALGAEVQRLARLVATCGDDASMGLGSGHGPGAQQQLQVGLADRGKDGEAAQGRVVSALHAWARQVVAAAAMQSPAAVDSDPVELDPGEAAAAAAVADGVLHALSDAPAPWRLGI